MGITSLVNIFVDIGTRCIIPSYTSHLAAGVDVRHDTRFAFDVDIGIHHASCCEVDSVTRVALSATKDVAYRVVAIQQVRSEACADGGVVEHHLLDAAYRDRIGSTDEVSVFQGVCQSSKKIDSVGCAIDVDNSIAMSRRVVFIIGNKGSDDAVGVNSHACHTASTNNGAHQSPAGHSDVGIALDASCMGVGVIIVASAAEHIAVELGDTLVTDMCAFPDKAAGIAKHVAVSAAAEGRAPDTAAAYLDAGAVDVAIVLVSSVWVVPHTLAAGIHVGIQASKVQRPYLGSGDGNIRCRACSVVQYLDCADALAIKRAIVYSVAAAVLHILVRAHRCKVTTAIDILTYNAALDIDVGVAIYAACDIDRSQLGWRIVLEKLVCVPYIEISGRFDSVSAAIAAAVHRAEIIIRVAIELSVHLIAGIHVCLEEVMQIPEILVLIVTSITWICIIEQVGKLRRVRILHQEVLQLRRRRCNLRSYFATKDIDSGAVDNNTKLTTTIYRAADTGIAADGDTDSLCTCHVRPHRVDSVVQQCHTTHAASENIAANRMRQDIVYRRMFELHNTVCLSILCLDNIAAVANWKRLIGHIPQIRVLLTCKEDVRPAVANRAAGDVDFDEAVFCIFNRIYCSIVIHCIKRLHHAVQ